MGDTSSIFRGTTTIMMRNPQTGRRNAVSLTDDEAAYLGPAGKRATEQIFNSGRMRYLLQQSSSEPIAKDPKKKQ